MPRKGSTTGAAPTPQPLSTVGWGNLMTPLEHNQVRVSMRRQQECDDVRKTGAGNYL